MPPGNNFERPRTMMPAPHAMPTPGAPPVSAVFHGLAARQLAGKGGRPVSPAPMQSAGAPLPLNQGGHPAGAAGHMPAFGR